MFSKLSSIIACVLSCAQPVFGNEPDAPNSDNQTEDRVQQWEPTLEDIARFQLNIPKAALSDAKRYNDTSALFYLSERIDNGIKIQRKNPKFSLELFRDTQKFTYSNGLNDAFSYKIGIEHDTENISPTLGVSYRNASGFKGIDEYKLETTTRSQKASWSRVSLSRLEDKETFYHLGFDTNQKQDMSATIGVRFFDVAPRIDIVTSLTYKEDTPKISISGERRSNATSAFIEATHDLSTEKAELNFGLQYKFGQRLDVTYATASGGSLFSSPTLKNIRRQSLDTYWRDQFQLMPNEQPNQSPSAKNYFSLDCILGCYDDTNEFTHVDTNNFGLPGLIDLPSAGRLPDGEMLLTQQLHQSLSRLSYSFQVTPRIGLAFRYSGHGVNGSEANGRVNHDRSFDIHVNLLEENGYRPGIALGLRDFIGTGWYSSEYIVATKNIGAFELTGGLGFGRLSGRNQMNNPFSFISDRFEERTQNDAGLGGTLGTINWFQGSASPFAGVVYNMGNVKLSAEYTSDEMNRERSYLDVKSPMNFGLTYKVNNSLNVSAQYLHGTTLSLTAKLNFNPKRPPNGPGRETAPVPLRGRTESDVELDVKTIKAILEIEGMELDAFTWHQTYITVQIINSKYRSTAQALGRISAILQRFTPNEIKRAIINFKDADTSLILASYAVDFERISDTSRSQFDINTGFKPETIKAFAPLAVPDERVNFNIGPYFDQRLFDPDQPVLAELGAKLDGEFFISQNLKVSGAVKKSLLTNLTSNERLSRVQNARDAQSTLPIVLSDWGKYDIAGQPGHIPKLTLEYTSNVGADSFFRASAGYLEPMYAGVGAEFLYKPVRSHFAIGLDGYYVKKRNFDMLFDLQNYETLTGHVSLYYDDGGPVTFETNIGRYLAKDIGLTTKIARKFANGWEVGAYATFTDVSFEEFGEGSFDKGFYVTLPIDWLLGTPTQDKRSFMIRPITRDGGARLRSARKLHEAVNSRGLQSFNRERGRIWK